MISHIFFDLHSTLVDNRKLYPCYSQQLGVVLAERYGLTPQAWVEANYKVIADWDSYYADLDLGADDGVEQMFEGMFRTLRALFRLTNSPEPEKAELSALMRELPELTTKDCDALYPDVKPTIEKLHSAGYVLGVVSHALIAQARGTLKGGGIWNYFSGPMIGPEVAERYHKDSHFFMVTLQQAGVPASQCLIVDDRPEYIQNARELGLKTAYINRHAEATGDVQADVTLHDLNRLLDYLKVSN